MIKFKFRHHEFKRMVESFYEDEKYSDKIIMLNKESVNHIKSGLPATTNMFILACNDMGVNPNTFFQ